MAEEQTDGAPRGRWKGLLIKLGAALLVALVAAGAALWFILGRVNEPEPVVDAAIDRIPPSAEVVSLEQAFTTVIMPDPNLPASTLMYKVSLECANPETAELVRRHMPRFVNLMRELHSHRTRTELNDPTVEQSIQRRARQRANDLLNRIVGREDPYFQILDVFHEVFYVDDKL